MKNTDLIVLRNQETGREVLADRTWFKKIPVSSTRDRFGQYVDPGTAGDYLVILTQKAADVANEQEYISNDEDKETTESKAEGAHKVNEIISAYECSEVFDRITGDKELTEDVDYQLTRELCTAYNYFDGSNYKSIVINYENADSEWEEIPPAEALPIIAAWLGEKELVKESFGRKHFKTEDYNFIESCFAGSWEISEVDDTQDTE